MPERITVYDKIISYLPNTSIIYAFFVGMAYTMLGTILMCKTIPY